MKIDISRANLLEKDIEDWLYENPQALEAYYQMNPIVKWIGRQYTLPSGIADLIGVRENGLLVVIEVKNVPINKAAVLQVCRYAHDLKHIVADRMDYRHQVDGNEPAIEMILVGPSIDDQTFCEARAVNVSVFQFAVELTLNVSNIDWSQDHGRRLQDQRRAIAAKPEWSMFGLTCAEDYKQRQREDLDAETERFIQDVEMYAREYVALHGKGERDDAAGEEYIDIILG